MIDNYAPHFAPAIEKTDDLIVFSLTLFEVFKRVLQQADESAALKAVTAMQQGNVVDLDAALAITAAKLSNDEKLPLADSIILTTARLHQATLWTQDGDFQGMDGVEFRERKGH